MDSDASMASLRLAIGRHKYALLVAVVVGLIYLAPHILFMWSLGDNYRGIPMMLTANEDFYLSRMQEILDGHPLLASPFFFEYKDQWPLTPPTGEMFYALPAKILNISLINVLLASRFMLPFILFLLVYLLINRLSEGEGSSASQINAIAGALLVTLGYDLVDFRNVIGFLTGHNSIAGGFLLWSRPINPILGAIFLMSFLICVWQIIDSVKYRRSTILAASVFLALMMASYFFSWGIALSILAALIAIYFLRGKYSVAGKLILILPLAFFWSAPYWYMVWRARSGEWYGDSVLRSGLFYTHYPIINKLMLVVLAVFILLVFLPSLWQKMRGAFAGETVDSKGGWVAFQNWHWFCLSIIAGSFWVYGQQLITGITIWPYHFVQYSIPLAMIVLTVLFYNVIRKNQPYLWVAGVGIVIIVSLLIGIGTQASAYQEQYIYQSSMQSYAPFFSWLNKQEKDCVVLGLRGASDRYDINILVSAFTHCNGYASNAVFSMMPNERPIYNYMATLRLRGVSPDMIEDHILQNRSEASDYLFSNWQGLFNYPIKDFPDFSDKILEVRFKTFPEDYRNFVAQDFESALKKYKINYIFSTSALAQNITDQFQYLKLAFTSDNIFVYQISNESQ